MTRTNVVQLPTAITPGEPGLFGFTYTAPRALSTIAKHSSSPTQAN